MDKTFKVGDTVRIKRMPGVDLEGYKYGLSDTMLREMWNAAGIGTIKQVTHDGKHLVSMKYTNESLWTFDISEIEHYKPKKKV